MALSAVAQKTDASSNHLLWRISGNGLERPSYLYGTMHLADKELFYFGDSLYAALEHTDGFAAELDLDGAFNAYISTLLGDKRNMSKLLSDADAETIKKYRVQLEKQIGKKSDRITIDDIRKEVSRKRKKIATGEQMDTFLDAYLFDLAGRMGKWTGGVEDFVDQFSLQDQIDQENIGIAASSNEQYLEVMKRNKKWYINERLDLLGGGAAGGFASSLDPSMVKRNKKMAYRMDSLAHERSTIFAVGAAHLPGDSGVITLLRKRGFRVEPVVSSRRIAPEDFVFKEVPKSWQTVFSEDSAYTVSMPKVPFAFTMPNLEIMKMKMDMEQAKGLFFVTGDVGSEINSVATRDKGLQQAVENYKKIDSLLESSPIVRDNLPGVRLKFTNDQIRFYAEVFIPGDYLVINLVGMIEDNEKESTQAEVERFFASFQPIKRKDFSIETTGNESIMEVPDYSFSIQMPESHSVNRAVSADSTSFGFSAMAMKNANQTFVMVQAMKPAAGYELIGRDSIETADVIKQFLKQIDASESRVIIEREGSFFHSWAWGKGSSKGQEMVMKVSIARKGELNYNLIKTTADLSDTSLRDDDFFRSFRTIPPAKIGWKWTASADGTFEMFAPGPFSGSGPGTYNKPQTWVAQDTLSAVNYFVEKYSFPRYFSSQSDSVLLAGELARRQNDDDDLISSQFFYQGAVAGMDAVIRAQGGRYRTFRLLLSRDTIYEAHVAMEPDAYADPFYTRPIRDFKLSDPQPPAARLFTSHVDLLVEALKSPDSLQRVEAFETLESVKFTQQDVPVLQEALLWAAETDLDFGYIWPASYIRKAILNADTARSSISFVRDRYQQLPSSATASRGELLSLLASQQTKGAFDLLATLTRDSIPSGLNMYSGFYDSLKLTGKLFPGWVRYLDDPGHGVSVTVLLSYLVKEKMADSVLLRSASKDILAIAASQLSIARRSVDSATTSLVDMVDILNFLQTPDSRRMMRSYGDLPDPYVKLAVVKGSVSQNEPVGLQILLAVAKDFRTRKDLYGFLKDNKKANLFPAAYKTAKWMGESELANWLDEDDYEVDSISWFAERIVNIGGKRQKIHLYRIKITDDEGVYLGVAGPYDLDGKLVEPDQDLVVTGVYFDDELDMDNLDEEIQTYLGQFNE